MTHALLIAMLLATVTPPQETSQEIPLYADLGAYSRKITTSSGRSQQYFDQGLLLAYAFGRPAAVSSFREAQKSDPDCAMCYWGEAWALGPYVNEKMKPEAAPRADQAVKRAVELAAETSPAEQALIRAMARRYEPVHDDERRLERDVDYAEALRQVVRDFPRDLDAGTLLAEALMVRRPWNFWTPEGRPQPEVSETIQILESVLARKIDHPGACHLYIHVMESSPWPELAEPCADRLAAAIPGASHIQHMPSHIYVRVGRFGDAVRANQKAWIVDQRAAQGLAAAIYPGHNLQMLVFAGWLDGQSGIALQAARDVTASSKRDAFMHHLMLVRFGRWEEALRAPQPVEARLNKGLWHFSRGMSQVKLGQAVQALASLDELKAVIADTPETLIYQFFRHRQVDLLRIAAGILEGEMAAAEKRWDDAIRTLEKAAEIYDGLAYSEPEPWPIPVGHILGAVQLEAGRTADAEKTYRKELNDHRENGWSLKGLELALRAQGRGEEAAAVAARFRKAWSRSDVWIKGSRF